MGKRLSNKRRDKRNFKWIRSKIRHSREISTMPFLKNKIKKFINLYYNFAIFLKMIKEMRMILPEEIKRLRIRCFLTQEDFAKKLGVAFSTVNRWEQGKSKPNLVAIKRTHG